MTALLWRSSRRHFGRHPWQAGLAVVGVALGVAVVVAVDLSIGSARRAFALSVEAVSGRATHQVIGGPAGLPDSAYRAVRVVAGVRASAPVVEGWVRVEAGGVSRPFRLMGIDPFAEAPFRSYADATTGELDPGVLIARAGAVLMARETAESLRAAPGDTIELLVGGRERSVWLAGVLEPADALARRALADLVLADIASAQELLDAVGRIDRIDLRIEDGPDAAAQLDRVRAVLPADARIASIATRSASTSAMTRSFELSLTALALLALVFGTFLIYNSMTFSVVQRRGLIGLLRAQGVTRSEVVTLVLAEAAVLGVVATALGVVAGRALGSGLVGLVTQTINDLYFRVNVRGITLSVETIGKAALLGVGATVLAALPAAWEASATAPRQALLRSALEHASHRTAARAGVLGALLCSAGSALLLVPARSLAVGLGATFILLFGAALLAPIATVAAVAVLRPLAGRAFGWLGRMATGGVAAALSRTGPAIAALTVAIAAGAAIALMIDSFRGSVEQWLDNTLRADVYLSRPSSGANRREGAFDRAFVARITEQPGVAGVSTYRNVDLETESGNVNLIAVSLHPRHRDAFVMIEGDAARAWPAFEAGAVLVSEPFAWRFELGVGDTLVLPTPRGPARFPVTAVFRDYATEFGTVFMDRRLYDAYWDDASVSSIGVFATDGTDPDALLEQLRTIDAGVDDVLLQPSAGIRMATLRVFDRTFAITAVLRSLALLVALVGVLAALMALQLERARELGVLRATGVTPRQLSALVLSQTGVIGALAGLFSLPLAAALAWAMVHVVNRRAFGWTIDLRLQSGLLAESLLFAITAALAAGIFPALRMARTRTADSLREE